MSDNRPNRYFPQHYFKIQCFINDETVKDLMRLKFCVMQEGESSIVFAIPKRRMNAFMSLIIKYNILIACKEDCKSYEVKPRNIEVIKDTVDLGFNFTEDVKEETN